MGKLVFKVASDWQEVVRLRTEVDRLEKQLKSLDANKSPQAVAVLNKEMQESKQQMRGLVEQAAKTGAVMGNDFKSKIYQGSQAVNDLTGKINAQRGVVRNAEGEVKRLAEAYRTIDKSSLRGKSVLQELTGAKGNLQNEKNSLFGLQQEQANARLSVKQLRDEYALYKQDSVSIGDSNNLMASSFGKMAAALGGMAALKEVAEKVVSVRSEFQQLEIAFTTMLKSKEKSDALMSDLTQFAATTPFDLQGVASGAKQLLAYGFQAEDMKQNLTMLGNVASGVGSQLGDLIYLYGTLKASGRVTQMDINQFAGRGIPIYEALSKVLKVSAEEVRGLVSAGKVGFPQVEKAFQGLTSQSGMFYNLMQNQSKSFQGQLSNLGDNVDAVFNKIGKASEEEISGAIGLVSSLVENYETVGKTIMGLVAVYGTYKAAVVLVNAVEMAGKLIRIESIAAGVTLTATQGLAAVATKQLTVAQAFLNKTMLANPYALAAALLMGACVSMYALSDSTTFAEKAQNKFNESLATQKKKLDELKSSTESLIQVVKSETSSQYEKQVAMDSLQKMMPSIFRNMDIEKLKMMDMIGLNKQLANEISNREMIGAKTNVVLRSRELKELKNKATKASESGSTKDAINTLIKEKEAELKVAEDFEYKIRKTQERAQFESKPKAAKRAIIENEAKNLKAEIDKMLSDKKKIESDGRFYAMNGMLKIKQAEYKKLTEKAGSYQESKKDTYGSTYKAASKEWEESKKALEVIEKNKDKYSKEAYKKAKEREETAEKAFKDLGGGSKTNKTTSHTSTTVQEQKAENLADKLKNERIKAELERNQRENDLIDNEYEKKKAVIDANHKKELADITRREEERLKLLKEIERKDWEKKNPKWKDPKWSKKNPFKSKYENTSSLPEEDKAGFNKDRELANKNEKKEKEELYNTLVGQYQSYEDKRIAIKKETDAVLAQLDKDRAEAVKANDTAKVNQIDTTKPKVIAEGGKALMTLDYEQLKQTPEYVRAFENLEQTSSETLNSLLAKLESAKGEAAKVLSPDQLREYTTTIQSVMDELEQRNPFGTLAQYKEELAQAEEELALASTNLDKAKNNLKSVKGGGSIESGETKTINAKTGKAEVTKTYLSEAQAADKVRLATERYSAAKDKTTTSSAKVKVAEKESTQVVDKLCASVKEVGNEIGGQAGQIIGLIGDIGVFAMSCMVGVSGASETASKAVQAVEKASVILAIISAAIQIATKIASLLSGDNGLEEYERASKVYESYIGLIDRAIDKQRELLKVNSESGKQALETAKKLLADKEQATRDIGRQNLNAGADGGFLGIGSTASNGRTTYKSISDKAWKEAAKVFNMSASAFQNKMGGRMEGLFSLSVEDIEKLSSQAMYFFGSLDKDTQGYLNNILEANKQIKEVEREQVEGITQVSFDSVYSSFLDTLSDMDKSSADFAEDFSKYMQRAVLSSMMDRTYNDRLKAWYKSFGKDSESGGQLDGTEQAKLKEEYDKIVSDALAERDELKKTMGWTGSKESQQGSSSGMASMSQDTGTELNGRFTALQMAGEDIKLQSTIQTESLTVLKTKADEILTVSKDTKNIADEIRNIQANSYLELKEISRNTGEIIRPIKEMNDKLDKIDKNTRKL